MGAMKLTLVPMSHEMVWLMKIASSMDKTRMIGMLKDLNANMIKNRIARMDMAEVTIKSRPAVSARSAINTASPVAIPPLICCCMICRMAATCAFASSEPAS